MIKKAIRFAILAHKEQTRKGTDFQYIEHPVHVGILLSGIGANPPVIAAGILHDTLEDTVVTESDILREFGDEVLQLVKAASEPDKSLPWKARKEHTIESLKHSNREIQM